MEHAGHALYVDVTSTLACWLPEDAEEFAENIQLFSSIENAHEKAHFRWKMQNRFGCDSIFWKRFALVDFQHATQATFCLTKLRQSGQDKSWRYHWWQVQDCLILCIDVDRGCSRKSKTSWKYRSILWELTTYHATTTTTTKTPTSKKTPIHH